MKKGLVLEVNKNYVLVLTNSGEYIKLKKIGRVETGDIYKGHRFSEYFNLKASIAAAVILIFFSSYNVYARQTVGVIEISGPKEVKLYVNRLGKVNKVEGIDENSLIGLNTENAAVEILDALDKDNELELDKIKIESKELKGSSVDIKGFEKQIENKLDEKIKNKKIKNIDNDNKNNGGGPNNNDLDKGRTKENFKKSNNMYSNKNYNFSKNEECDNNGNSPNNGEEINKKSLNNGESYNNSLNKGESNNENSLNNGYQYNNENRNKNGSGKN